MTKDKHVVQHDHMTTTSLDEELNDDDDVPTDRELRATGANGPKVSATTRMQHGVGSQVSHSLTEDASQPAKRDEKAREPKEPPC